MSTKIYDKNGIHVTRFYGGQYRGICYQIDTTMRFAVLRKEEFIKFIFKCIGELDDKHIQLPR